MVKFLLGILVCFIPAKIGQSMLIDTIDNYKNEISVIKQDYDELNSEYTEFKNSLSVISYLGEFKITYYCPCEECSGEWGTSIAYPCAENHKAIEHHTVAVDPEVIPIGTTLLINGKYYIAEDVGSAVKGNVVDIFVSEHLEEREYADVFMVREQ